MSEFMKNYEALIDRANSIEKEAKQREVEGNTLLNTSKKLYDYADRLRKEADQIKKGELKNDH